MIDRLLLCLATIALIPGGVILGSGELNRAALAGDPDRPLTSLSGGGLPGSAGLLGALTQPRHILALQGDSDG